MINDSNDSYQNVRSSQVRDGIFPEHDEDSLVRVTGIPTKFFLDTCYHPRKGSFGYFYFGKLRVIDPPYESSSGNENVAEFHRTGGSLDDEKFCKEVAALDFSWRCRMNISPIITLKGRIGIGKSLFVDEVELKPLEIERILGISPRQP